MVLLRRNIAHETQEKLLLQRNIPPQKIQPCLNGEYLWKYSQIKRARQSIKIDLSISTRLISIENTRDTISQRAIYLFLNGVNPYNSIINIFKKHPCLKILVIFVYAIQVFMAMFAFVVLIRP